MSRNTKKKRKAIFKKIKKANEREVNSTRYNKRIAEAGQWNCMICPAWEHENALGSKHGKKGKTKARHKNKTRDSINPNK